MDRNRQKYVELSLAGRWLKLAREIILDNPGIDESRYLEIAVPLMPTHISTCGKRKKATQLELARRAIHSHLSVTKHVRFVDGKLFSDPIGSKKGYQERIMSFARKNSTVSKDDLPDLPNFSTYACRLCRKNVLRRIKPGVYAIAEVHDE